MDSYIEFVCFSPVFLSADDIEIFTHYKSENNYTPQFDPHAQRASFFSSSSSTGQQSTKKTASTKKTTHGDLYIPVQEDRRFVYPFTVSHFL